MIMGRRTFDNSIPEWGGSGPVGDVPCFVVTHDPPSDSAPIFTFVTDGIESALAKAREAAGDKRIGLMGAGVPRHFLAAGLVDEIRIHLVDVLLGGGRWMFEELPHRVNLKQTGLREDGGVGPCRVSGGPVALRSCARLMHRRILCDARRSTESRFSS